MDILCLIGVPTDIATKIGNGNVYYLGTGTSFDISTLAPDEYENFTTDNFISLITTCSGNSISIKDHTGAASSSSYSFTVVSPGISDTYSPSTGRLSISTSGFAGAYGKRI